MPSSLITVPRYKPRFITQPVLYLPLWRFSYPYISQDWIGHLVSKGGVPVWTPQGYSFDGIDDYLSLPVGPFDLQVFTIIMTFKPTTLADKSIFSNFQAAGTRGYGFRLAADGTYLFATLDNSGSITWSISSAGIYSTSQWLQLAVTCPGNALTAYLYKNGVVDANSTTQQTILYGTSATRIGMTSEGGIPFSGIISEALFYNRALSAGEIMQHYLASKRRMPWIS